ncbi:hypothetical protein AVEN_227984-1 [Araneus ventricosus]|uniref:Reverse transcriptase zinc-binding domain-containing protein n=1 Tax=Araneus ventricosus TaxID=182803 RepID=A0A4Y2LQY8_ARAVE|nr:hypothetical protein AVEN_227984-1 [Araneus ventricosus]
MKVLGIFFSANLSFNCHFNYVAKKALKRLGYLRALGGSYWGANTVHLLRLVNACIRSIREFGAEVTSYAGSTSWRKLKVVHHNCLLFAAGLPRWTPIPVMLAETGEIRLRDRKDLRKVIFRVQADQGRIQWESTKYFRSFTHLPKTTKTQLLPRRKEILLTRLRTRSLPTKAILFKVGLESSPLCRQCGIVDSNDHLLLTCNVFEQLRNNLGASLGIGAFHYDWICTISTFNRRVCSAVLHFLQSTNLF